MFNLPHAAAGGGAAAAQAQGGARQRGGALDIDIKPAGWSDLSPSPSSRFRSTSRAHSVSVAEWRMIREEGATSSSMAPQQALSGDTSGHMGLIWSCLVGEGE